MCEFTIAVEFDRQLSQSPSSFLKLIATVPELGDYRFRLLPDANSALAL